MGVDIDIISLESNYYLSSGANPMYPPRKISFTHSWQMSLGSSFGKNEEPEARTRDSYVAYVTLSVDKEHDSRDETNPVDSLHISRHSWIKLGMWAQYLFYGDVLR